MKTLTFINTSEGLKAYEKPEPPYEVYPFVTPEKSYSDLLKEARSAALIVENPEVQFTGLMFQCGKYFKGIGKGEFQEIKIGDEFPCPSNVEWEVVYQYHSMDSTEWRDCSEELFKEYQVHLSWRSGSGSRKVIRLSVKQEDTTRIQMPDQEYQVPRIVQKDLEIESLRSEIKRLTGIIKVNQELDTDTHLSLNQAHATISQLKAENQQLKEERRWIPVSERLPEDQEICVVLCPEYSVDGIEIAAYNAKNKTWTDTHFTFMTEYVTHWMPSPPQTN
jgi:hypothetical protein